MQCSGTLNGKRNSKQHFQSKEWYNRPIQCILKAIHAPVCIFHPIWIHLHTWTYQITYSRLSQTGKASKLAHHKFAVVKKLYLIRTESGVIWYVPISSSWVTGSGVIGLTKEQFYGAHQLFPTAPMDIVCPPRWWCTRAPTILKISIVKFPDIVYSKIHHNVICIVMGGSKPSPIYPPHVDLLPSIPKSSSMVATIDILIIGHWMSFGVATFSL